MENNNIPRPEYPRPQFLRNDWMNLNGEWDFLLDQSLSGEAKGFANNFDSEGKIIVPFCPESRLSGVEFKDFINGIWYKRSVTVPKEWFKNDRCTFINIDACDYETKVFVNGKEAGRHIGGYTSFSFEITELLTDGENNIVIFAKDDTRSPRVPSGKQSTSYGSYGCFYTRTTGIWQTVWLENTPKEFIKSVKITSDRKNGKVDITAHTDLANGKEIKAEVVFNGKTVGKAAAVCGWRSAKLTVELSEVHEWNMETPNLYDIIFTLGQDSVKSYFGLRDVAFENGKTYLNGKSIFQRLILDQGFYPDGIYTAPNDSELVADIERSKAMGFNGARLHQKVFEPRFLYHCDRLGYIVWGEHANWGFDSGADFSMQCFVPEWLDIIKRDYNHPAIIGWCPLNETGKNINQDFVRFLHKLTLEYDPDRIFIDNSGWCHVSGTYDMYDVHDYCGDPEEFKNKYLALVTGKSVDCVTWNEPNIQGHENRNDVSFVSEFGGARWVINDNGKDNWGYGSQAKSEEEFIERYKGLVDALLDNPKICAFCYTQLTDVEQEQNGLYTYDRVPKFKSEIIKKITSRKAAVED